MARTKTNIQNNTKIRRTPRRNRHLEKTTLFQFFGFFFFPFLFIISYMISPKHVKLPPWYGQRLALGV